MPARPSPRRRSTSTGRLRKPSKPSGSGSRPRSASRESSTLLTVRRPAIARSACDRLVGRHARVLGGTPALCWLAKPGAWGPNQSTKLRLCRRFALPSGGGGIRTLVGPKWPETVFETCAWSCRPLSLDASFRFRVQTKEASESHRRPTSFSTRQRTKPPGVRSSRCRRRTSRWCGGVYEEVRKGFRQARKAGRLDKVRDDEEGIGHFRLTDR
jgi:hypothetical protein